MNGISDQTRRNPTGKLPSSIMKPCAPSALSEFTGKYN